MFLEAEIVEARGTKPLFRLMVVLLSTLCAGSSGAGDKQDFHKFLETIESSSESSESFICDKFSAERVWRDGNGRTSRKENLEVVPDHWKHDGSILPADLRLQEGGYYLRLVVMKDLRIVSSPESSDGAHTSYWFFFDGDRWCLSRAVYITTEVAGSQ